MSRERRQSSRSGSGEPPGRTGRLSWHARCLAVLLLLQSFLLAQDPPPVQPSSGDRELDLRVDRAVDRGVAWLLSKQRDNGSFGPFRFHDHIGTYESAFTALALLALLASGANKYGDPVRKGFEFLLAHPPRLTYEIGITLMAYDMKAAPLYERFTLASMDEAERRRYRFERNLEEEERAMLAGAVRFLVENRYRGLWHYRENPQTADISNTQYAVLGLRAAARCGLRVPTEVWTEVLEYFLAHQLKQGEEVRVPLCRGIGADRRPDVSYVVAKARGWDYEWGHQDPAGVCGSRVHIGIACLAIAREELLVRREHRGGRGLLLQKGAKIEEALRDALAWLHAHWSIERNPTRDSDRAAGYLYYYLYALERTGALLERRYLGDHDWYREGAEFLLREQRDDGSWPGEGWSPDLPDTCFALLFLKRSTVPPVLTGR